MGFLPYRRFVPLLMLAVACGLAAEPLPPQPGTDLGVFPAFVDFPGPTLTITLFPAPAGAPTYTCSFSFSAPVTGFDINDLVVGNGVAFDFQGNTSSYGCTVVASAGGQVSVSVLAGAAVDFFGGGNAAASAFVQYNAPPLTLTLTAPGFVDPGQNILVGFAFSAPVSGFDLNAVSVGNGTKGNLNGSGSAYTGTFTAGASGILVIGVPAGGAHDDAGNLLGTSSEVRVTINADPGPGTPASGTDVNASGHCGGGAMGLVLFLGVGLAWRSRRHR